MPERITDPKGTNTQVKLFNNERKNEIMLKNKNKPKVFFGQDKSKKKITILTPIKNQAFWTTFKDFN
jgi:hypothetical protein